MNKKNLFLIVVFGLIILGIAIFKLPLMNSDDKEEIKQIQADLGAVIELNEKSYDFGRVIFGEVVSKEFEVLNKGDQPLVIKRLSTSCGCTSAEMVGTKTIAPGEKSIVKVSFDPAVHKDNPDLGQIERIVYIKSNDQKSPEITIEISALVVMP